MLLGALTQIAQGVGSPNDPPTKKTVLGGLNAIQQGLEVTGANDCLTATIAGTEPKNCGAIDAVKALSLSLTQARNNQIQTPLPLGAVTVIPEGYIRKLLADIGDTAGCQSDATSPVTCQEMVQSLSAMFENNPATGKHGAFDKQLGTLQDSLNKIAAQADTRLLDPGAGLDQLRAGLSNPNAAADCAKGQKTTTTRDDCGIKEAALAVRGGVPLLVDSLRQQILAGLGSPTPGCDPTKTLRCGAAALTDGLGQLDSGAHQLSDGLNTAADGSGQLSDGLQQARNGAPQLEDGANKLSKKGVVKIVQAGQDTTQQYGKLYATLTEGAKRAHTDGMIYGAPAGSMGLMAYDFEINGSDGQDSRNVAQALLAIVLGGLGLGAFALRRRSVKFLPS